VGHGWKRLLGKIVCAAAALEQAWLVGLMCMSCTKPATHAMQVLFKQARVSMSCPHNTSHNPLRCAATHLKASAFSQGTPRSTASSTWCTCTQMI